MTREICKCCFNINKIGFNVPNIIWKQSVPKHFRDKVLCIDCFSKFADEQLIDWDIDIQFYPVSLKTSLENTVKNAMAKIGKTNNAK